MKKISFIFIIIFSLPFGKGWGWVASAQSGIITTIAGNGIHGYSGDGGQATSAEISNPAGLAIDAIGNLYIADESNSLIRKITTTGIISTITGNGTSGFSGDGGQATASELSYPICITLDAASNLYIADESNHRIRKVNTAGIITTVAGNGTAGFSGDGGQATAAEINAPEGVAFDIAGNFYIGDYHNYRVRMVNTSGIINTVAGNGTMGYSGDGGAATAAELNYPCGLTIDAENNIYIADLANNRVRKINTLGIINTIAGNGTQGYSGDGGQATAAELYNPAWLTFDAAGNLYISDMDNNSIRMVNSAGIISAIAGNGTAGYSGDGGAATAAELHGPQGIAFDSVGNLYFSDYGNNCIRKVTSVGQAMGIEQLAVSSEQVKIYPNPNNGSFVIEPQNTLYNVLCTVYDVNGKLVLSQTINGKTTIDASPLNEGVYNISIISNEGVVNKRLVIVK